MTTLHYTREQWYRVAARLRGLGAETLAARVEETARRGPVNVQTGSTPITFVDAVAKTVRLIGREPSVTEGDTNDPPEE